MSEIEKMYENAGIEVPTVRLKIFKDDNGKIYTRPPFTAEKVLKVIVFFLNKGVRLDFSVKENTKISVENFKECIAQIGVKYWQYLSEEERKQIKEILE